MGVSLSVMGVIVRQIFFGPIGLWALKWAWPLLKQTCALFSEQTCAANDDKESKSEISVRPYEL